VRNSDVTDEVNEVWPMRGHNVEVGRSDHMLLLAQEHYVALVLTERWNSPRFYVLPKSKSETM
jgi:hypothetical protein